MERLHFRQRLKWAVAILCALLSPIVGMVVSVCGFWRGSLIGGIAVGGGIGVALYFVLLWRELKLKEHRRNSVLAISLGLFFFTYLWVWQRESEMAVLMLIYIPVFVTLLPLLHEMDKKPAPSAKKPSPISARIGVVALYFGRL